MRIFGVFVISLSFILFGFYFLNKFIERIKQLNKICYLISTIKQEMIYKKSSLNELLNMISNNNEYNFLNIDNNDITTICDSKKLLINKSEKNALKDFFDGLGETDLKGQINHCEMFLKIFEEFVKKFYAENQSKIKIFPTLIILFGMLIIILLF